MIAPENDGPCRCPWARSDALYIRYHDEEWGVPKTRDADFFEKLILEGFQSGLSWLTILRKREGFRKAFDGFEPEAIARYDDAKVAELLANAGIIRHRGKIEAAVANARAYLDLVEKPDTGGVLLGLRERRGHPEPLREHGRCAPRNAAEPDRRQRAQGARLSFLRPNNDLFPHAGLRARQRPPHLLSSLRRMCGFVASSTSGIKERGRIEGADHECAD